MIAIITPRAARRTLAIALAAALWASAAFAHVSEKAFVLLLPTPVYIAAGVLAVALTIVASAAFPPGWISAWFGAGATIDQPAQPSRLRTASSLASFVILLLCIATGFWGTRNPLANPLVLLIWTLFWIALPVVQICIGNIWRYIEPWSGPYALTGGRPGRELPPHIGHRVAILQFMVGALFALVYIAPDDPYRLAVALSAYWLVQFGMMHVFGPAWLDRAEPATVFLGLLARLAPMRGGIARIPGWQLVTGPEPPLTLGLFALIALASGSFDGLNETFWWLSQIGVNPLAFPGRSAVWVDNLMGYALGVVLLPAVFAAFTWAGLALAGERYLFRAAFPRFALAVVPIIAGYHIAHYIPSFLVQIQYVMVAISDPMGTGWDWMGLGEHYVSTGFFNSRDSVRLIWLSQALAIVIGHMLAILVAHAIAIEMIGDQRKTLLSQVPVSAFMVGYTLLGLWLLATPTAG